MFCFNRESFVEQVRKKWGIARKFYKISPSTKDSLNLGEFQVRYKVSVSEFVESILKYPGLRHVGLLLEGSQQRSSVAIVAEWIAGV